MSHLKSEGLHSLVVSGLGFVSPPHQRYPLTENVTAFLLQLRFERCFCSLMFRFRARMVLAACNNRIIKTKLKQQNNRIPLPKESSSSAVWIIFYSTLPVLQLEPGFRHFFPRSSRIHGTKAETVQFSIAEQLTLCSTPVLPLKQSHLTWFISATHLLRWLPAAGLI